MIGEQVMIDGPSIMASDVHGVTTRDHGARCFHSREQSLTDAFASHCVGSTNCVANK